jgi:hypothetical protein
MTIATQVKTRAADPRPPQPAHGVAEEMRLRVALWFGLLGGCLAWTAHLTLAYVIGEWGCVWPAGRRHLLGISGTAWVEFLLTILTAGTAIAATIVAHRCDRRLRQVEGGHTPPGGGETDTRRPAFFAARAGTVISGLFAYIILVETLPTLFFLQRC